MQPLSLNWQSPGCCLYHDGTSGILVGCIAEVLYYLALDRLDKVKIIGIVLSDTSQKAGISNWAIEEPIRQHIKHMQADSTTEKFTILGTKKQIERARELLTLSFFGPTAAQYKKWSRRYQLPGGPFKMLLKSSQTFGYKRADGSMAELDDWIDFKTYHQSREASIGSFLIKHRGTDWYEIGMGDSPTLQSVRLRFEHTPLFPDRFESEHSVSAAHRFGVKVVTHSCHGQTSGCASYLIWLNGVPMLWNATPYIYESLQRLGLSVDELGGVIISQLHEDNGALLELLTAGESIDLYTTVEIYECLLQRIAALTDRDLEKQEDRERIEKLVHFHPISCAHSSSLFGVTFQPHYCTQALPTIGGRLEFNENGEPTVMLITGAFQQGSNESHCDEAHSVSKRWIQETLQRIVGNEDLDLYETDGGKSYAISFCGQEGDVNRLGVDLGCSLKVAPTLEEADLKCASLNLAYPGYEKVFAPSSLFFDDVGVMETAFSPFRFNDRYQLKELLAQGVIQEYGAGTQIIKEGDQPDLVYIVMSGKVKIEVDKHEMATLSKGFIFGEMAVISGESRCADAYSISPSRIFQVSKSIFEALVEKHNLVESFQSMWQKRDYLNNADVFRTLPYGRIQALTKELTQEYAVDVGTPIVEQGALGHEAFLIISGQVRVIRNEKVVAVLKPGDIFGEMAALSAEPTPRSATVVSKTACRFVKINGEVLRALNETYFSVNCVMHDLMRKRSLLK